MVRVDIGGGIRLFIDVVGSHLSTAPDEMVQRPVLLALHGGPGSDHSMLRPYFDRFADTHCVLYVDQRGNGRSDQVDARSAWDLDTWADDVMSLCGVLEISRPVLLGHSFGGAVAIHAAGRHPQLASSLILSSALVRSDNEAMFAAFEARGKVQARLAAEEFWNSPSTSSRMRYADICRPLCTRAEVNPGRRAQGNQELLFHWIEHIVPTLDLRESASRVECPTLVLSGEDDPVCTPAFANEVGHSLTQAEVHVEMIPDCGHIPHLEQPGLTEHFIRDFLGTGEST